MVLHRLSSHREESALGKPLGTGSLPRTRESLVLKLQELNIYTMVNMMQRHLQPFLAGSGVQLPAAILPLAAAPQHQLLGASCQPEPFLWRISLLKDTWVTWRTHLGQNSCTCTPEETGS